MILLLNFVIAILSSTFASYEDKSLGLYYEVVIKKFSQLKYDDQYGYIACGAPPCNIIVFAAFCIWNFLKLFINDTVERRRKFNHIICLIIYIPYGIIMTLLFAVSNVIIAPVSYFVHIARSFEQLVYLENGYQVCRRLLQIFSFVILGPVLLLFSTVYDILIFFKHLFSEHDPNFHMFNKQIFFITQNGFNQFEELIDEIKEEAMAMNDKFSMIDLNKRLRDKQNVYH